MSWGTERDCLLEDQAPKRPKVFCIGFQKTGTTSLSFALEQLGYRVSSVYDQRVPIAKLKATYVERGLERAKDYDAVQDMPWPLIFRELDEAFPGSKFILSMRDTDKWWNSIVSHFGANPAPLQQLTYGEDFAAPAGNEARYREVYENHNRDVLAYFADRPDDLLEFWLERGHGWNELGAFLGLDEIPDGEFVRANTSGQRATLYRRIRKKLAKFGFPALEFGR